MPDMVTNLHFAYALLPEGWRPDVRLTLAHGKIAAVTQDTPPSPADVRHIFGIPGLPNLHSHAFQRAMAGRTEHRGSAYDSFWTWREHMYRTALRITPEQLEAIATQLYAEMLQAGFTRVGEFHYLHHAPDGRPYDNQAELATRIASAAAQTGIGLTLLPVFYAHANFAGLPPTEGQRRFITSPTQFAHLLEASRTALRALPTATIGIAPHSLRAVTPDELATLIQMAPTRIHIHIAEQQREVADCLAWSGATPVAWLLDHAEVNETWCLIHATHMTDAETTNLARTGAVAGLCPVTEANLGDGIFPTRDYLAQAGKFGIGTDSNIIISAAEELRQLEYAQRLHHRARNVLAPPGASTGLTLFRSAHTGGSQALAISSAGLAKGAPADIVSLRANDPAYPALTAETVLDTWLFAAGSRLVDNVWVAGRRLVSNGRHHEYDAIAERFASSMMALTE